MQLPAIDQNVCGKWTQVDKDFYNKLPFYFTKFSSDYRARWATFSNLFKGKVRWQPNMGDTMRSVSQEWSPILRQEAVPELLCDVPTTDIVFTRERTFDSKVYRHRFQTREFNFCSEFQDFFEHAEHEYEDLQKQITYYNEAFLRTRIFHYSPRVYLCGVGLVEAPTGLPSKNGTTGKTDAWVAQQLEQNIGPLTLEEVFKIGSIAETQIGMTPYEGSGTPKGDNNGIDQRWCLILSNEQWMQFTNDPWTKENRPLAMDIVNNMFKGALFGNVSAKYERFPLRYKYAANVITRPAPEIVSESVEAVEKYRTAPNPDYTINSQYVVNWWIGGDAYKPLEVGPPPSLFTKSIGDAMAMNWNGKPSWTKDFLIQCKNEDGTAVPELNSTWGENIRAQAQLAMGITVQNAFNILPIISKRQVGITTTGTVI